MKPLGKSGIFGSRLITSTLQVLALFLLYYITAELGLNLDAVSGFATLFWLPTGISLAAVVLFGYRMSPGILLGAFVVNYLNDAPLLVASTIAIGNTLEAVVGAYMLKRFVNFQPPLERLKDVLGLIILAAFLSTLISATFGVASLQLSGLLRSSILSTFIAWWVGDLVSNLVVAPFVLVWSRRPQLMIRPGRVAEVFCLVAAVAFLGVFVFRGFFGVEMSMSPLTYIVFPPLIWAALRFGQREVVTALFLLSLFAVWGTSQGHGPFVRDSVSQSLLYLQGYMIVVSATSLILASVVSERRVLERRKDDFISFASHELKTPITSLKISAQIFEKMFDKRKERRVALHLRRMDKQINRLVSLINNMLDVSKIQRTTLELQEERFFLHELIDEIAETVQSSTNRTIVRRWNFKGEVVGDRERIGQVISNLLANAVKYSPQNKKVMIITRHTGRVVTVSVKDQGRGIPAEHQSKIFERFYRVADAGALPGLGIGLYLSNMIIKLHNGDMWVESKEGKGSTFSFSLPRP